MKDNTLTNNQRLNCWLGSQNKVDGKYIPVIEVPAVSVSDEDYEAFMSMVSEIMRS